MTGGGGVNKASLPSYPPTALRNRGARERARSRGETEDETEDETEEGTGDEGGRKRGGTGLRAGLNLVRGTEGVVFTWVGP